MIIQKEEQLDYPPSVIFSVAHQNFLLVKNKLLISLLNFRRFLVGSKNKGKIYHTDLSKGSSGFYNILNFDFENNYAKLYNKTKLYRSWLKISVSSQGNLKIKVIYKPRNFIGSLYFIFLRVITPLYLNEVFKNIKEKLSST